MGMGIKQGFYESISYKDSYFYLLYTDDFYKPYELEIYLHSNDKYVIVNLGKFTHENVFILLKAFGAKDDLFGKKSIDIDKIPIIYSIEKNHKYIEKSPRKDYFYKSRYWTNVSFNIHLKQKNKCDLLCHINNKIIKITSIPYNNILLISDFIGFVN